MKASDFDFHLPPGLIAQEPLADRASARMLVLDRAADTLRHATVRELPGILAAGDLLVVNETRVIPARLYGRRADTGGKVEVLLLEELAGGGWVALYRAGSRARAGQRLLFAGGDAAATVASVSEEGHVTLAFEGPRPVREVLQAHGVTPLPPYIRRPRQAGCDRPADRERYQTVFARQEGAVAAPTAGLHFTPELLAACERRGIGRAAITLHVGPGTFRPVSVEDVEAHRMDPERYEVGADAARRIAAVDRVRNRVVAVGTTSVRTCEAVAAGHGRVVAATGRTALFIRPPYRFLAIDALLTNFHLPRSTLLMLVSAFAGRERVLAAYGEAVRERYRFYSYGDCMLIL